MADITNFDNGLGEAVSPEQWANFVFEALSHECAAITVVSDEVVSVLSTVGMR